RVARLHGDEDARAGGGDLAARVQLRLDGDDVALDLGGPGDHDDLPFGGRGALELAVELGRDGGGRRGEAALLEERRARAPVGVAVQERAADAPVEDTRKGLVVRLRMPVGDELVPLPAALDAQPLGVRGATSKADAVGRVLVLHRGGVHGGRTARGTEKPAWSHENAHAPLDWSPRREAPSWSVRRSSR